MADERIEQTREALAPLWELAPPTPRDIYQHPAYVSFKAFCERSFASADRGLGFSFGLTDALRAVGVPCFANGGPPATPDDAARALVAAFDATTVHRRYLCPLNNADRLPEMRFGRASIRRHSHTELLRLFDARVLERCHQGGAVDPRLAEFQWLVVEETLPAPPSAGQRAMPYLYESWSRDLGAVDPHAGSHPGPVLNALFGLLLAPWEDWHSNEHDWRAFSVPWIHVATDDPFVRPKAVPSADTLDWEDVCYHDHNGPIDAVRPLELHLYDEAGEHLSGFDDVWWARVEAARATSLLETPVEHFLVRAALSNGMDQIMAHMTAIEAAVGLESDFSNRGHPPADRMSATQRMAKRVGRLLGDAKAEADYASLFEIRSAYVHGRVLQGSIPSEQRNKARRLARKVAVSLIDVANSSAGPVARADYLTSLA